MATMEHADDRNPSELMRNSSLQIPALSTSGSYHLCMHNYAIDCAVCPEYDECPYPDRTSSLMSVVLPAGITVLSIAALLAFFLVIR